MRQFLDELSRRRVFRATAWYVAFVLAGWQAADYVIAALALPEWLMRYAVLFALAGLPVVVVVSWMIDIRTVLNQFMAEPGPRHRRLVLLAGAGVLLLAAIGAGRVISHRPDTPPPGRVEAASLERGIESYFSGDLDRAASILGAFGADSTQPVLRRQEALRYRARAHSERGDAAGATAALEELVELEPPLALMLPGVETDSLMALYYRARLLKSDRPGMAAPPAPVTAIHVLSFMTAGSPPSEFGAEFADAWDNLGRNVSSSLMVELQRRLNDVTFLGSDAVTDHRFDTYRYLQSPDAARLTRPSHLIIGSLAGAREQLLLSAWMIEAEQGTVAHSAQVIVPSGQFLFERIGQLSRDLVDQVERAHQSTPDR
jgi:hypothetical protein